MMLRFQWDSLRRGDRILVHDVNAPDLGLQPAVVEFVDSSGRRRDVAARYTDGPNAGVVVRPGRFAAHPDPLDRDADCWRCEERIVASR